MPRNPKVIDEILIPLEAAKGALYLNETARKIAELRIRQALTRHPDLENLLSPISTEIERIAKERKSAREQVSLAISFVKDLNIK